MFYTGFTVGYFFDSHISAIKYILLKKTKVSYGLLNTVSSLCFVSVKLLTVFFYKLIHNFISIVHV